ncbi:MAG: DUF2225 domain-containing protein [bacterium]|nr:DUF2225 domain-containing protein [bacterium]
MLNESPIFLSKIECPICKTVNEFETLRVGAYAENDRDTDFCPKDIVWRYPRYQAYNPLAFFCVTCDNCYYSREFTSKFKEWKQDNNFRAYRLKAVKALHLDKLAEADSIIRRLGESLDIVHHPNETAVVKLLLAIYDELLYDHPNHLDLGRFYLRIGWVFRSLEEGEDPNLQFLRGMMTELDGKYSVLGQRCHEINTHMTTFKEYVTRHFENERIAPELKLRLLPYQEKFDGQINQLNQSLQAVYAELDKTNALISDYRSTAVGGDGEEGTVAFGSNRSFNDFLFEIKKSWSGVVANEREALEKAIHHYKEAMEDSRTIQAGNQQIQASYLIAELSRRVGDYDGARQYFNNTIKYGQEFVYENRRDQARTALARKILELAIEQGKANLESRKVKA